jgi:nucleotide-binding universal stress UspA family protein
MATDRITRALQDYLRVEQYLATEKVQIDAATRQREQARRELEGALHSPMANSVHPLAAGIRQVLSGSGDLTQIRQRLNEYLRKDVADGSEKPLIVVAVDNSDPAFWAVAAGGKLALRLGARVLLVHVINPVEAFAPETYVSTNYYTLLQEAAEAILDKAVNIMPAGVEATVAVEEGDPAMKVAALSQERGADYIVIGTHGRGRIGQLIIGSTATAVARLATCPVMVISHPPEKIFAAAHQEKTFTERLVEKLNPAEVPLD